MGRLAYMQQGFVKKIRGIWWMPLVVFTSCASLGSPVSVTDRPLSERIADRSAEQAIDASEPAGDQVDSGSPNAIAFSDALASGEFLRLSVATSGVDASLRSGPGSTYDVLTTMPNGAEVLASGTQTGEWVYVVYGDFEGWLSNRRLTLGENSDDTLVGADELDQGPVVYVVAGDTIGVNMRAEPDAQSELVSGAPVDSQVVGTGRTEGSWIEVTFNGVTGWSSGNYLTPIGNAAAATPTTTVAPITGEVDE